MATYLSESERWVKKVALEVQKKFPAENEMSEASSDIQ
jgi:hypothetical protein